jgi:L-asparaginase
MSPSVRILTTGGTFDKVHDWRTERLEFAGEGASEVPVVLAHGRCDFPFLEHVFQVDSLEMTDADREVIAARCAEAPEECLVVTHGTSTMAETARYLAGKALPKTIVLTGAMRPHSLFVSDAGFNLGGALVAAQTLGQGVWAVMNGRVFAADEVRKDTERGRFDG